MNQTKYQEVWDLDSLFMGGSESLTFMEHMKQLEDKMNKLEKVTFHTPQAIEESHEIASLLEFIGNIRIDISQATSFIACLLAQNSKDQHAHKLRGKASAIQTRFDAALQNVKTKIADTECDLWEKLLDTKELKEYTFILTEWRNHSNTKLSDEAETIISHLSTDGYHAWGQFYQSFISNIKVKVEVEGIQKELSVGQAINLRSHHDEAVRKEAHTALETKWVETEEHFAKILNHIAGFRLQVYQKRGLENGLEEPLIKNRMKAETIAAMWSSINKAKAPFINYLNQKASLQGSHQMKSYNFWAPVTDSFQEIKYEYAVEFIIEHFGSFGSELELLSKRAFDEAWVEVENRGNKSPVAFCAGFPLSGESRICMNFGGTMTNVLTLAHELGHAYHNHAMVSVKGLNKQYPMSMAETASTFCEMIVLDAAMEKAKSDEEKLTLLDEKLKRSVMNFMNIHSRFIFEKRFYEERKHGIVPSSRLSQIMKEAISEGYCDSMDHASIHSWIWTPHFYNTKEPFYNFPYTFGYLFALSIYAKAKKSGIEFERDYIKLLRDSGSMSVEELVMKHVGEDITSEGFWNKGIDLCVKDAKEFNRLTAKRTSITD
ncbi:pantothenate kinase [Bacillus sp. LL01]|uniref:M3 family oligoendopeptidase n=1 Tax=Bacillus sp. LL01 TaxID=1665556 RepID=UPI00064D6E86|nr:M3 family oligoendopeptidase [Bacillus sp. LL01]KMJ57416.1 pantothenate kinase [Bacillus sp. LL01]